MNTHEILTLFCATTNEQREYLRAPMRHGDFLYATNGHIAVRLPNDDGVEAQSMPDHLTTKFPKLFLLVPPEQGIPLPPLPDPKKCTLCNGTGHIHRTECPDCDGEGTFVHGSHEYECKECDGEGVLSISGGNDPCPRCGGRGEASNNPVQMGCVSVDARYLRVLEKLSQPMLVLSGPDDPVVCRFDGGVAVVSTMRVQNILIIKEAFHDNE